jgi:hypothetical protein
LEWITFQPPDDRRTCGPAELMTMLDNPKFPTSLPPWAETKQQLPAAGEGGGEPAELVWSDQVVLHDGEVPGRS